METVRVRGGVGVLDGRFCGPAGAVEHRLAAGAEARRIESRCLVSHSPLQLRFVKPATVAHTAL